MAHFWFLDVRIVLICVFLFLVLRWFFREPKNLPPGPWCFPIIGAIPAIVREIRKGVEPHELFVKYAAKYGPVFRLKVMDKTLVILNDFSSVKKAFQHPQLSDRPMLLSKEATKGFGLLSASGERWTQLRRFSLNVLRSFGIGKSNFEEKIGTEAKELLKEMTTFNGKSFDPKALLANAVSNVICSVIFGKRYEYTDCEFAKLLASISQNTKLLGSGGVLLFFPRLRHLPFFPTKQILSNFKETGKFLKKIIDDHHATFDANNLNDFIDVYLLEIQKNLARDEGGAVTGGTTSKSGTHVNESNLVGTIRSLFGAGTETTATTLQWFLLYMITYPDVQQQVQAEIDAVVGRNRLPKMADKPDLNFTQAVIWEVQRLANILPLGGAHAAASDTYLQGFLIPKDALIVPNMWMIFRDPKLWPDPDQFKPTRFLKEGKAIKPDELTPYSIGRRSCVGEHLAKMELFIFFTYLMHQFTFRKPANSPPLTLKGRSGITHAPQPFEMCATKRDLTGKYVLFGFKNMQ